MGKGYKDSSNSIYDKEIQWSTMKCWLLSNVVVHFSCSFLFQYLHIKENFMQVEDQNKSLVVSVKQTQTFQSTFLFPWVSSYMFFKMSQCYSADIPNSHCLCPWKIKIRNHPFYTHILIISMFLSLFWFEISEWTGNYIFQNEQLLQSNLQSFFNQCDLFLVFVDSLKTVILLIVLIIHHN